MSVAYAHDREKGILRARIVGRVTMDEMAEAMRSFMTSGDHPSDLPALWDLRDFDFESIDRRFTEGMVALRARSPERGRARIAMVVDDDLGFGMMRMYVVMSDALAQEMEVFREIEAAERWLVEA